jgi:AraC-like DNA-binding protein
VLVPRPEVHLVARFGPTARGGVEVHAFGGRHRVHRKSIPDGQRAVTVRLQLGVPDWVLGVPASTIAAGVAPLEDLWGDAVTSQLRARLADARDMASAAAILERSIAERMLKAGARHAGSELALAAAGQLAKMVSVQAVARALGVSERHLRRVFHETIGMGPKAFVKLTRFRRALLAARRSEPANWASIAADAGYYDQAHLIAEFRAISGVTPRALLGEVRAARLLV